MLSVALTGNIASGKSTVAELFRRWGATVIDADEIMREVQAPGSQVMRAISARFGEAVVRPDGSLDRPRSAARRWPTPRPWPHSTGSCIRRCTARRTELMAEAASGATGSW